MAFDATLNISLIANLTKTAVAGNIPRDTVNLVKQSILSSGTAAAQSDTLYYAERTISASSNEDLDLTGTLTNSFGQTVTLAEIQGLIIIAAPSSSSGTQNTNNVVVGDAAANTWTTLLGADGTVTLRPGTFFMVWAGQADATGYAVTAGTGDQLRVANSGAGTSVTYQIFIIGRSA